MYIREEYLLWLEKYLGSHFIKVLVGMRRVGKSTLLLQFIEHLKTKHKYKDSQILFIDKESLEFADILNAQILNKRVNEYFSSKKGKKILFIDEIQEIENWEKAVTSILKKGEIDIYITGSNAHLLSSDLATYLAGRYVKLNVYSFTYKEFLAAYNYKKHDDDSFERYLTFGGFPGLVHLPEDKTILFQTLDSLYSSIILRDIVERYKLRNVELLEKLVSYFFDNIGNIVSAKSIADYLKSQRLKVSVDSVQVYIGYLAACFAIYRVKRYDIKGKKLLEVNEKHYLGDVGLRHATLGYRPGDIGQLLENIVYIELLYRGYSVSVGKVNNLEVDFIAEKNADKMYIQVAYLLESEETRNREFNSLKKIQDAFPKYVLTMDKLRQDEAGIKHYYLPDFLLNEDL